MNQLDILRESLGQCDEILLDALLMRNRIVEDIMAYKEANDIPILQPEQEAKQREWLNRRMEGRRHKDEVTAVFEEITRCYNCSFGVCCVCRRRLEGKKGVLRLWR